MWGSLGVRKRGGMRLSLLVACTHFVDSEMVPWPLQAPPQPWECSACVQIVGGEDRGLWVHSMRKQLQGSPFCSHPWNPCAVLCPSTSRLLLFCLSPLPPSAHGRTTTVAPGPSCCGPSRRRASRWAAHTSRRRPSSWRRGGCRQTDGRSTTTPGGGRREWGEGGGGRGELKGGRGGFEAVGE